MPRRSSRRIARSPEELRPQRVNVEVVAGNRAYHGSYTIVDGILRLGSAYGSKNRRLGRSSPGRLAKLLLVEVLEEYYRARL